MTDIKVLVVEDEAIVALEIQDRLISQGYRVCGIAASGEKAITIAQSENPDLVLMDIKLKGVMNGIDTAKILKEKLLIPSIFITAFSDENTLNQIRGFFNYEYLLKPFEEEELNEAVIKTLKRE
jgi:DNA-binding NarL/FixJ family response regulator